MPVVSLPDQVNLELVEHAFKRSVVMRFTHAKQATRYSARWAERGVRLARSRDPRMLKFLSLATEQVWRWQQWQLSRFRQEGFEGHTADSGEFAEVSVWKNASMLADAGQNDALGCDHQVFQWVYGACAEAVYGSL